MRAKGGDPPRTMCQKILASHCDSEDEAQRLMQAQRLIEVRVDQVVLAREPNRILASAVSAGLTKSCVEVSIAYPSQCFPSTQHLPSTTESSNSPPPERVPQEAIALGFLVAQPGAGFAAAVHLERFSSPARILLTDEPRLASSGAAGMLCLPASRSQLSEALIKGVTSVRPACSVQVQLSGRIRPFVSVRDVALEMLRLELKEVIQAVDARTDAPVVLEFVGPSCKFLSVSERCILAAMAPQLGAAGAIFSSDEKTEMFLRHQRRSKAHRSLEPDAGAPFEEVVSVDLAAVEPLIMDENGRVRPVRELEGREIKQVLLGGDSGVSLRDFFAVSALLKSKRVAPGVDFLLCPPSRQTLEVLATGPLPDLIATGARIVEPDTRVLTGEFYGPASHDSALKTCDHRGEPCGMIASPETLAHAVFNGQVGDPRSFKRPVRITVPRQLPTDDVLLSRGKEARGGAKGKGRVDTRVGTDSEIPPPSERFSCSEESRKWNGPVDLAVTSERSCLEEACAFVADNLDDVRWLAENATSRPELRAVIASHIPAATVAILSGLGVLALRADEPTLARLGETKRLRIFSHESWDDQGLSVGIEDETVRLEWLAVGQERKWMSGE